MTSLARLNGHNGHSNGYHRNGHAHPPAPPVLDKPPPQNLEAEQNVLAAMAIDNRVIPEVLAFLRVEDFFRDNHQTLFRAIVDLYQAGTAVDGITLADELTRRDEFQRFGGDEALSRILLSAPHAANAVFHARIVQGKALARAAVETASQMIRDAYSDLYTGEEVFCRAGEYLRGAAPPPTSGGLKRVGSLMGEVWDRYERRARGEVTGLKTGFTALDDTIDGFQSEELIVVAGRPSMGKSLLAMNFCENQSVVPDKDKRAPTLFLSLEMGEMSLAERCLVSIARLDGKAFRQGGKLTASEHREAHKAMCQIEESPLHLIERVPSNYLNVQQLIREAVAKEGIRQATVDYVQLMNTGGGRENRTEELDMVTQAMKDIARECKIPVVLVSQLNRALESRGDKRPLMSDLRGSGAIEQHADVVLFLHRPHYFDPKEDAGVAEVIVAKNRNGPTGTVHLAFSPQLVRFDNLDTHNAQYVPPPDRDDGYY